MTDRLQKLRPALILLAVLVVAAILGYVWGISSVRIESTGPWQLETGYLGMYVQGVADSYALDGSEELALERLSYLCQADGDIEQGAAAAAEQYGAIPSKLANLDQLMTLVNSVEVVENADVNVCGNRPVGTLPALGRILAPLLLVLGALGIIGYGLWTTGMLSEYMGQREARRAEQPEKPQTQTPAAATPATPAARAPMDETAPAAPVAAAPAAEAAEGEEAESRRRSPLGAIPGFGRRREEEAQPRSAAAMGAQMSRQAEKTDFEATGQEPPLVQFMTTYLRGDDLYDDSFSIESASGEFLGETGVGISETLASPSEAKEVTALEVWLFDKNDIRTVTKVLMSDFAYNDESIRTKLAPKGEAVLAQAGKKIVLQTATLRVQARVVDLSYAPGTTPPESVIERITIELAAWRRPSAPGDRPSGGLPSSEYDYDFPSRGNLP